MKEGFIHSIDDVIGTLRRRKHSLKDIRWTFCFSPITARTLRALTEIIGEWLELNYGTYPSEFSFEFEDVKRLKKLKVILLGKNEIRVVKRVYEEILKIALDWEVIQVEIEIHVDDEKINSANGIVSKEPAVIEDGQLYQSYPIETVNSYLRLYLNGDFMLVSAMGSADNVLKWLKPGGKHPVGRYSIKGNELFGKITITIPKEPSFDIDVRAKLTGDGIVAHLYSGANNSKTTIKYKCYLH